MVVLVGRGRVARPHAPASSTSRSTRSPIQILLTLGVSMILFYGGLGLAFSRLRPVVVGLGLLADPRRLLTALVTASVAALAFDVPFEAGLLVGAVLAPTDPAILIPLFEQMGCGAKVRTDDHRGVGTQRRHRRGARAGRGRLRARGRGIARLPAWRVPRRSSPSRRPWAARFGVVLALVISSGGSAIWRESPSIAVLLVVAGGYFAIDFAGGSGYLGRLHRRADRGSNMDDSGSACTPSASARCACYVGERPT